LLVHTTQEIDRARLRQCFPNAKQFEEWLDPEVQEPESIGSMLKACPAEWMECADVSTLVKKPANNWEEVPEPLSASS